MAAVAPPGLAHATVAPAALVPSAAAADADTSARPTTAHRTTVRPTAPGPDRAASERRPVGKVTSDDRILVLGAAAAALAMTWLICTRLLPWGTPLAFVLMFGVAFLVIVAVATWARTPGPMVGDRVASVVITGGAILVGVALVSTVVYTFARGWPALWHPNMILEDMTGVDQRDPLTQGGVKHAIIGSVIEISIAIAVTLPLGLGTAVFMTEVGGGFARVVRTVVEAMTALPSIVAGLFIYAVLIVTLGVPRSGFAAACALSVMMLPIIARSADVVLRVIPGGLREASLALGASRWRTVWHVVLPTARPGLATALILGVARGVGETSPVLLTSGLANFVVVDPTNGVMNSLPLFIYDAVRSGEPLSVERGFAAASILLALVLTLFVTARRLARPRRLR